VIFPEGTRTEDGRLQQGKPGIGFIVAKSGVPVVPAYIEGSFEAMPRGQARPKRCRVRVYIGKPVSFTGCGAVDKDGYRRISDSIMGRIAELKEACEASRAPRAHRASPAAQGNPV
jgi:1-acyl-sn-glycerol-3-phosphate acyltransferase